MFFLFGKDPPLHFLCSTQTCPSVAYIPCKPPHVACFLYHASLPLHFLYSAQRGPYILCVQHRIALMFSDLGEGPRLRSLYAAQA